MVFNTSAFNGKVTLLTLCLVFVVLQLTCSANIVPSEGDDVARSSKFVRSDGEDDILVISSAHGQQLNVSSTEPILVGKDVVAQNEAPSDEDKATLLEAFVKLFASLNNETSPERADNVNAAKSDHDLTSSESSYSTDLAATQARNLASWLRDTLTGSWLNRRRQQPASHQPKFLVPVQGHHYMPPRPPRTSMLPFGAGNAPPPHPGFAGPPIPNFLPAPEGFPNPYSSDSVLLPNDMIENAGIDYWLNFIEQAAANKDRSQHDRDRESPGHANQPPPGQGHNFMRGPLSGMPPPPSGGYSGPINIGDKPSGSRRPPTSIRDELLMANSDEDSGEEETGMDVLDGHFPRPSGHGQSANQNNPGPRQPAMAPSSSSSAHNSATLPTKPAEMSPRCDKFTAEICVDDFEYPEQAIVDEIYKRREIFELLYSEDGSKEGPPLVEGIPRDVEESYIYEQYLPSASNQPQYSSSSGTSRKATGYVCPSEVLYGKPKLAKNRQGDWKVIVNAAEFTQTIRMEKCLRPNARCQYIVPSVETRCAQVHAIHRLMVFEKGKGFFMDTFKIPTGCNCQLIRHSSGITSGQSSKQRPAQVALGHNGNYQPTSYNPSASSSSSFEDMMMLPVPPQPQQQQNPGMRPNKVRGRPAASQTQGQPNQGSIGQNTNAQLSNTLWSILMGPNPQGGGGPEGGQSPSSGHGGLSPSLEESVQSQLNLLQHLKSNYPHLSAHISPEAVLQQLTAPDGQPSRQSVNLHALQQMANSQSHASKYMFPGQTTTIVNPGGGQHSQYMTTSNGGHGGAPVVQVIHVPVSSGGQLQPVYKPQQHHANFLGMAAYESANNVHAVKTTMAGGQDRPADEEGDSGGGKYLSSAAGARYTPINHPNASAAAAMALKSGQVENTPEPPPGPEEDEDEEEDEEDEDAAIETKFVPVDLKRNRQNGPESGSSQNEAKSVSNANVQPPNDSTNNQQLHKRMLDKKINFNYHPILEYIPTPAVS